ncbi:tRNA adenosine deaminase-associated protein [Micromonospora sp. CPCC 206060]|uniref:tRNA adenosine deaminase-associated protein n=1 Tax=Micromonospora sp. CPCC 206060 TaxID=3122406 RepID=UPI002FF00233
MAYFAAAVVRDATGWTAAELDLTGMVDLDEVADRLRDVEPDARTALLFVESDDIYLVIMRLDDGEDLRVFASDSAFAEESRLGAVLVGDIKVPAVEIEDGSVDARPGAGTGEDDNERPAADPDADPVGDADLLADLGISASRLLRLCAHEGMLPADVIAEICQVIGCADEVEDLRGV